MPRSSPAPKHRLPTHPLRAEAAEWMLTVCEMMDAARPGCAWFSATFHPCLGRCTDTETAAAAVEARVRQFDGQVSELLIGGRRWMHKKALQDRPWAILLGQDGFEQGFHFHGFLNVPHEHAGRFQAVAPAVWRRHAPFGDPPLFESLPDRGWAGYAARHLKQSHQAIHHAILPHTNHRLPFAPPPPPRTPATSISLAA